MDKLKIVPFVVNKSIWVFGILFLFPFILNGKEYYVAKYGSQFGDGTFDNPWDMQTGLNMSAEIAGGDTLFIREGTYVGKFTCSLTSSSDKIVIMPYNNEYVVLDGVVETPPWPAPQITHVLTISGDNVLVRSIEITSSETDRVQDTVDDFLNRSDGIMIEGDNVQIINCIIHDCVGNGLSAFKAAQNSLVYGCVFFNNGFERINDEATGYKSPYAIYTQNDPNSGIKRFENNVFYGGTSRAFNAYTRDSYIQNYVVKNNIFIKRGALWQRSNPIAPSIYFNAGTYMDDIIIDNNTVYHDYPTGYQVQLGLRNTPSGSIEFINNRVIGASVAVELDSWNRIVYDNNQIVASQYLTSIRPDGISQEAIKSYEVDSNSFYVGERLYPTYPPPGGLYDFQAWQVYGYDLNGSYSPNMPTSNIVIVHENEYEKGRASIAILNYEGLESVAFDLSNLFIEGESFYIYDIENMGGEPIKSGVFYGKPINIPMNLSEVTQCTDPYFRELVHTNNEFGAYLVMRRHLRENNL
jgi:hypothetical protein